MTATVDSFAYRFCVDGVVRTRFLSDAEPGLGQDPYESDPVIVITLLIRYGDESSRNAAAALLDQHNAGQELNCRKVFDDHRSPLYYAIATMGVSPVSSAQQTPVLSPARAQAPTPLPGGRRLKFPKR